MAERCSKDIFSNGYGGHQCSRVSTVVEEGKPWCRQHSPSAVKERRAKKAARIDAKVQQIHRRGAQQDEMHRRAECFPDLLAALEALAHDPYLAGRARGDPSWGKLLTNARAAIAKAKERK